MDKLFVFGCSHATGDYNITNVSQSWPNILASKLNKELVNHAVSGYGNDAILVSILNNLKSIEKNDKIFILLTHPERILVGKDKTVIPSRPRDEWWYELINDDFFYQLNFYKIINTIHHILVDYDYKISYVDPSILIKSNFYDSKLLLKNSFFLPKMTLSKSFKLGDDKKHLSVDSHEKIAEYFFRKL